MKSIEHNSNAKVDPKIQMYLDLYSNGFNFPSTSSTSEGEIAVIAEVSELENWEDQNDIFKGANLGQKPNGNYIVTARVPLKDVNTLAELPYVQRIQSSQIVIPTLKSTIKEIKVEQLKSGELEVQQNQGKDVIVGIIDFGCDFVHLNFRNSDGTSRILALWDQTCLSRNQDSGYLGFGEVYTKNDIDNALKTTDPYNSLGYCHLEAQSHGTHVMDIACGNGQGSKVSGVAPKADIIFVHISHSDVPWAVPEVLSSSSLGGSVQLLEAIKFIFAKAGSRPCVINISLGTYGGPHDGTTLVEQAIDTLVMAQPNRAIIIAAGNSYNDKIHASGKIVQGNYIDLIWKVKNNNFIDNNNIPRSCNNELEIWYDGEDEFELELIDKSGTTICKVNLDKTNTNYTKISDSNNSGLFYIAHYQDSESKSNTIGIFISPTSKSLNYPTYLTIRLHGSCVNNGNFHAWIERQDQAQSQFDNTLCNSSSTLGSISCGHYSIAVGSYNAKKHNCPLSSFSSAGPTRDKREKPEISAPGHYVFAASSRTIDRTHRDSGTSMAAPVVTGVVALMLAEARSLNKNLTIQEIRAILAKTARLNPPSKGWHDRYGMGRVDALAAIQEVHNL